MPPSACRISERRPRHVIVSTPVGRLKGFFGPHRCHHYTNFFYLSFTPRRSGGEALLCFVRLPITSPGLAVSFPPLTFHYLLKAPLAKLKCPCEKAEDQLLSMSSKISKTGSDAAFGSQAAEAERSSELFAWCTSSETIAAAYRQSGRGLVCKAAECDLTIGQKVKRNAGVVGVQIFWLGPT